jgi:hypothetical protein
VPYPRSCPDPRGRRRCLLEHSRAPSNDLTASLTGTGGVTISTPDNNSAVTSPVQVTANVASGFTVPVKTMEVFRDNTLVYQGPGTTLCSVPQCIQGSR